MNSPDNCGTMCFSPMPDLGYDDPLGGILRGEKTHTIRTRPARYGYREVTMGHGRTGIIIEITGCRSIPEAEFLTDEFAQADGLRDADALATCLKRFYEHVPASMFRLDFRVVRVPDRLVKQTPPNTQEVMEI